MNTATITALLHNLGVTEAAVGPASSGFLEWIRSFDSTGEISAFFEQCALASDTVVCRLVAEEPNLGVTLHAELRIREISEEYPQFLAHGYLPFATAPDGDFIVFRLADAGVVVLSHELARTRPLPSIEGDLASVEKFLAVLSAVPPSR